MLAFDKEVESCRTAEQLEKLHFEVVSRIKVIELKPHLSESYIKEADETLENVFIAKGGMEINNCLLYLR